MKRNWKRLMASGTVLTVLAGALTLPALASVGQRTAALHYQNIKVTLDGRTLDLTDSRGNEVEPFTIDGTTYLPLASISKALGMDVRWDADTNTVILNTKEPGEFTPYTLFEDGRRVYDVELYSGSKEDDYEIDAASGDILSWDYDAEYYTGQAAGQTGSYLSEAEVRQIVEDRAGVSGTFRELHLDRDDGRVVYEGEMRDGWTEYEFTLDAVTGTILEWDVDRH